MSIETHKWIEPQKGLIMLKDYLNDLVTAEKLTADEAAKISEFTETIRSNGIKKVTEEVTLEKSKLQEQISKLTKDLAPLKELELEKRLDSLLPANANKELTKDIIALSGVKSDMTDDEIKKSLASTVESREYLQTGEVVESEDETKEPVKSFDEPKDKPKGEKTILDELTDGIGSD